MSQLPPSPAGDVFYCFLSIILEGAPYIVIGTLISGFIDAFVPPRLMERLLPRNSVIAVLVSGLLGFIFPVCECAIVPVIRRLVNKGLPVSCAVTYMLAAPIINPIVAVSTYSAFRGAFTSNAVEAAVLAGRPEWWIMGSRLGLGFLVSVLVGLALVAVSSRRILRPQILAENAAHSEHSHAVGTADQRISQALSTSMRDFLDTAMYFVIGVLITSVFNTRLMIQPNFTAAVTAIAGNNLTAIPGLMALAVVLSLCSTTDAFIAANLQGFSMAAKLAFLVFGPMVDLKLLFMYASVFQKRFVLLLVLALFILIAVMAGGWFGALHALLPPIASQI